MNNLQVKKRSIHVGLSIARWCLLISIAYIILYPIFYMLFKAITPVAQAGDPSVAWIPRDFAVENFVLAYEGLDYLKSLWNTLSVPVLGGMIEVLSCAVIAYGFARFRFKGKNLLFGLVILTMIVPPQAIIIPLYLNFAHLDVFGVLELLKNISGVDIRPNLLDTGWTFWLPSLFGVGLRSGLFIFIYRQFFIGLPKELEEAASIDGAGPVGTLLHIVFPSSGTAFLCVTVFSVIAHWNDYYLSVMYFNVRFPLSVALDILANQSWVNIGDITVSGDTLSNIAQAGSLMFFMPVLLFYLIIQKYFIRSIDKVGIVG